MFKIDMNDDYFYSAYSNDDGMDWLSVDSCHLENILLGIYFRYLKNGKDDLRNSSAIPYLIKEKNLILMSEIVDKFVNNISNVSSDNQLQNKTEQFIYADEFMMFIESFKEIVPKNSVRILKF